MRRFLALITSRPSFASVSTRGMAPVGSAILPVYNALGGPQGKGHVTFDRAQSQYLNAGSRTLNVATNAERGPADRVGGEIHGNCWKL
jgi:hypothetical protein